MIVSQPQTALLSAVFMASGPTITTRSVAFANTKATDDGCVVALDKKSGDTGLSMSGSTTMNFSGCALDVNANVSLSGGTISAKAAYISGTLSGSGLTTTDGTVTGTNPLPDPYGGVQVSWPSPKPQAANNKNCDQNNYKLTGNKTRTISASGTTPYVFCNGIDVQGGSTLNLCAGTYIIDQGTLKLEGGGVLYAPPSSGCATTGGVTIILSNDTGGVPATITISANSTFTATAPTSGTYSGISIFQDRVACTNNSCGDSLGGGSTQNITGVIYFPDNSVSYFGGASTGGSVCTKLVAYTITFTGNSNFSSTCTSAGTGTISYTNGTLVM